MSALGDIQEKIRSVSLATRMLVASALLALLVAGVFAVLIQAVSALNDATQREAQARDLRAATFELEKLVVDLETGLRGFVLTNEDRFLQPWRAAREDLPQRLEEFQRLAATNEAAGASRRRHRHRDP